MRTRRWFPIAVSLTVLALLTAGGAVLAHGPQRSAAPTSTAGAAPEPACADPARLQPFESLFTTSRTETPRCEGAPAGDLFTIGEGALNANPHFRGTCRCSCGYPCQTDADCGGAPCMKGITCC